MTTTFISYLGSFTGVGYLLGGINGAVSSFTLACILTLGFKLLVVANGR